MPIRYQRKIIRVEKRLGFMYIPAVALELITKETTKVKVVLSGNSKPESLNYNK